MADERKTSGLLESVLDQVPDGVIVVVGPELRIVFANEAARRLMGAPPRGAPWSGAAATLSEVDAPLRFFRPDGAPIPADALPLRRSVNEGVTLRGEELVIESPDGARVSLQASTTPIVWTDGNGRQAKGVPGAVVIFQEIDERLRQEAALRETVARLEAAQARQRRLAEITRAISGSLDLADVLEMLRCAVIETLGFDRAGIFLVDEDRPIIRGVCGTDRRGEREDLGSFCLEMRPDSDWPMDRLYRGEIEYYLTDDWTRDGHWPEDHPCHLVKAHALVPLRAAGRVVGILAVDNLITDRPITEEQVRELFLFADTAAVAIQNARLYAATAGLAAEREAALTRARDKLIQSEPMALVGQFAGRIVHDLRNPLNVFQLNLQLLRGRAGQDERISKPLDRLEQAAARAEAMVADLLDLARLSTPRQAPTPIEPLLQRLVAEVQCPEGVQIQVESDPNLPTLHADVEQLRRALQHLLSNAIWALGEQGGSVRLSACMEGDEVCLSVSDTGCGIPEDQIPQIFQPFYALRSYHQGNGLGLAICQKIVENHLGSITVETRLNEGSTFTIRLPQNGLK